MDTEKLVWPSRRVTGLIGVPMSVDRADELGSSSWSPRTKPPVVGHSPFRSTSSMATPPDPRRPIRLEPSLPGLREVAADDFAVLATSCRGPRGRRAERPATPKQWSICAALPVSVGRGRGRTVSVTGDMMPLDDAAAFAADNDLLLVSIADVVRHRRKSEILVEQMGVARCRPSTATSCVTPTVRCRRG